MSYAHYLRAIGTDKPTGDALLIPVVGNPDCTEELVTELRKISDGSVAWFTAYPLNADELSRAQTVSHPTLTLQISERAALTDTDRDWIAAQGYDLEAG